MAILLKLVIHVQFIPFCFCVSMMQSLNFSLKGTVSQDFLLQGITFPQAPENNSRTISNFFKKSQRYSLVKVHHCFQ
jgi:hypothetical protein